MTKCFYVVTDFSQDPELSCRDKVLVCPNKVG